MKLRTIQCKLATALSSDSVGRFWWPSLLLLLVAAGPAAKGPNPTGYPTVRWLVDHGDTAFYLVKWAPPVVDAQHPAATFYHRQLILGDSMPHQPILGFTNSGTTWGYSNVVAYQGYYYPIAPQDTLRIVRPLTDSLGPYTVAVQAAIGTVSCFPGCPFTLGPYVQSAHFWVRIKQFPAPNPPGVPTVDSIGLSRILSPAVMDSIFRLRALMPVTCTADSATARSLGLVSLSVRPGPRGTWVPNVVQKYCCFGMLKDGRKVKFRDSWNDPYCESLYQQFLAEVPV